MCVCRFVGGESCTNYFLTWLGMGPTQVTFPPLDRLL